ncbi:obscurin-like protein 1 [Saccoglossus kowalevskii]|uniref:Titin-like n=1 Tax=Saccoglossus kowalevskii TaxID=10224 RepID=A0ABM0MP20_SACKO|nr:PREDICTED: titin-like [Saccoglossus kowalevskii]
MAYCRGKKMAPPLSNDATIVAADSRLTILNPSVGEYNLQIDDVSVNDVGSYVCFVSEDTAIGDSSIQSNPANLIMQDAAVQNMTSVPEDTETITGLEVSLECSVFHKEGNVIWSKDGVDISNDVFITNGDSQLSIVGDQSAGEYYLRISSAALSDTGVYQCRVTPADNSEEIISPQAILTVEEPQSFIVEPVEEVAVEGDVIVLTCSVENKHGTLHWKKDGAILTEDMQITANDPSLSVVTSQPGREYNLQINALSMEHMGEYLCHVTSAANGDVAIDSDSVKLTVYDAAVQDFTTVPVDTNIVAGKSVMLDCVVSNKEGDVIWSKDGVDITKDGTVINGDARYSIAGDATNGHYNLQIDDAEVTDTGEFQCRATAADNSDEISTPKIDLVVDDPQTFIEKPDDATITEGETVIFNCSVSNKHGTLHWKKDRNTISTDMTIDVNDPNIAIVSDNPGVTYNLKMKNVIPDDAGVYVCYVTEATNGDSSIESQAATLTVFDLAIQQLGTTPSDLDLEVVEGSTVVLQFSVQHKEGFVIWSKDGADISNDVTILNGDPRLSMVGDHTSGEYNLQITDLSAEDSGSYQARVTSADNSPEIHAEAYTLSVEASQSFTTEPSDIGEVEGETITLPCSVSNKHGSLSWKKDGVVISNDGVISVSDPRLSIVSPALGSDYNLRIDNINLGDDGEYTCYVSEADNGDAAIESGIAKLTVYDSEVQNFTTVPSDVILEVGETVLLTCTVYHKEGTLIWSRNGEDISNDVTITTDDNNYSIIGDHDSGEYNLQITNAQPVDSGQYECWVTEGDNSDQIRSGEVSVSIRGPDSPLRGYPKCTSSTEDKLILGETLILVCESIGGNPAANLRWVQDGMIQEGIAMDTNTEVRLSLVLTVTEDLLGTEFICQSNHPTFYIPETCSIGPLDIDISQTQVVLFSKDTDKTTKEGANMVMECTALNKAGTLHWIKDGQMISSDTVMETGQYDANRYSIRGDQSVGEYFLNIDDVRNSDAGTYYCLLSSNEDGMPMMSSKAINFHIDDAIPPNINFPQCTISSDYVIDGDTVLLTCITKGGDPPATLQWDQDGQNREGIYIDESIVGLQINASAEVNGNTFTCTSSHSTFENPRTCVIELRVESRPTDTGTSVGFWITLIFLIIALIVILLILFFCVYKRREDEKEYNQQGYKRNNDIESSLASLPSRDELYTHTGKPTGDGLYINRPVINTDFTDVPADAMNVGAGVSQTVENKPVQIREKRKTDEATKKPKKKKKPRRNQKELNAMQ